MVETTGQMPRRVREMVQGAIPVSPLSVFGPLLCRPSRPDVSPPNTAGEKEPMNERLEPKTPKQPHDPTETHFHPRKFALAELRCFLRRDPNLNMSESEEIHTLLTKTCACVARRAGPQGIVMRF